ncbi:MAG: nucleoside triphosphate pyrophosphohydrolase [Caulobacterales bacterium]
MSLRAMSSGPSPIPLSNAFLDVVALMKRLRDPRNGCPWDKEQTYATIAPYTIEEAYEVADAIERSDMTDLREELGDLLFQVVFHSRIAEEAGEFTIEDVMRDLVTKMTRRHPHVFGSEPERTAGEQPAHWEAIKDAERKSKGVGAEASVLDNIPVSAPALMRAEKLAKAAAKIGFDWPDAQRVLEKLDEERAELEAAIEKGAQDEILDEMGDLLFVCANIARKLKVAPEDALRRANAKFVRRFSHVEARARASAQACDLATLEDFWLEAKRIERGQT